METTGTYTAPAMSREEWDKIAEQLRAPFTPTDVDFRVQGRASESTGKAQVVGRGRGGGPKPKTIIQRFSRMVHVELNGCWRWTGHLTPKGYPGYLTWGGRCGERDYAHRVAYRLKHGDIPDGCEVDHLCRNRWCVNPEHLEAVPHRVNVLRGDAPSALCARKSVCKRGHPLTPDNLSVRRDGARVCKRCKRQADRASYARKARQSA